MTLAGLFFGALGSRPRVEYAVPVGERPTSWDGSVPLLADRCVVAQPLSGESLETIECELVEGGGANLQWRAIVGGQASAPTCWASDVCPSPAHRRECEDGLATCACRPECLDGGSTTTTSYAPPVLSNLSTSSEPVTQGGFELVLDGENLGSFGVTEVDLLPFRPRDRRSFSIERRYAIRREQLRGCTGGRGNGTGPSLVGRLKGIGAPSLHGVRHSS